MTENIFSVSCHAFYIENWKIPIRDFTLGIPWDHRKVDDYLKSIESAEAWRMEEWESREME